MSAKATKTALLGLDIGTTTCKLAAYDREGELISESKFSYETKFRPPGFAELLPADIEAAVLHVFSEVSPHLSGFPNCAIAISTQGEAFVPVDSMGHPLSNAPISIDERGKSQIQAFVDHFGEERLCEITGHRVTTVGTLSKILWMQQHTPEVLARTTEFLCLGEYIQRKWGLRPRFDHTMAARTQAFDIARLDWSDEILKAANVSRSSLPEAVPSGTHVGVVPESVSAAMGFNGKLSVFAGGHDQTCAALGAGIFDVGLGLYSIGTAEALAVITEGADVRLPLANISHYPHVVPSRFIALSGSQNGGRILEWFRKANGYESYASLFDELPDLPSRCLVLPFLAGADSTFPGSPGRGALVNFDLQMGRPQIAHAVLEGITFEQAASLQRLRNLGLSVDRLTAVGGGSRSKAWLQIKSDMLDLPIETLENADSACAGAAILAGIGCGVFSDIDSATRLFVKPLEKFRPRPAFTEIYRRKFEIYNATHAGLQEAWNGLRDLGTLIADLDAGTSMDPD